MADYKQINLKGLKDGDLSDNRWTIEACDKREYCTRRNRAAGATPHAEHLRSEKHRQASALGGHASHPIRLANGAYERLGQHNHHLGLYRYARALLFMPTIFDSTDIKEHLTKRQWDRCKHSNLLIRLGDGTYKKNEYEIDQILLKFHD